MITREDLYTTVKAIYKTPEDFFSGCRKEQLRGV